MYFAYFDETGDDGYPEYSSPLFVQTAVYFQHSKWRTLYDDFYSFRKYLKENFGIPIRMEFHTKKFVLNKKGSSRNSVVIK